MSDTVGYALIGCGRVAYRHVEAIEQASNARLVAVCDLDDERAQAMGGAHHVPSYRNYHDMLQAHPEADVVSVITPSGMHPEHATDVLTNHRRHVLIEKPMVMTPAQGEALKACAESVDRRIFPVYQNRYNKAVQRVREGLQSADELGQIRVATVRMRWCRPQRYYDQGTWRGTWAMDGGALTNQGIHYVDLLRYLAGDVKRVCALTAKLGADIEVEDTAVAVIEFQSGALGVIEVMTCARHDDFEASVSCVAANGLAVIAGIASNDLTTYSPNPEEEARNCEVFPTVYGFGHNVVIEGVADAVLNGVEAPIELDDGLETIRLLHAIYRSDELQQWVNLADDPMSERLGRPDDALAATYRTPSQS